VDFVDTLFIFSQTKIHNYGIHRISTGLMEGTIRGEYINKWEEDIVKRVLVKN
jgi:hypothetical protein